MSILKTLARWVKGLAPVAPVSDNSTPRPIKSRRILPPVHFEKISVIPKVLPNASVQPNRFYVVAHNDNLYWALFQCPDGCGEVISLPLRLPHKPRWSIHTSSAGRATLKPSVWRNQGCKAHFVVEDGRVFWCNDTGIAPSLARPDLYSKR